MSSLHSKCRFCSLFLKDIIFLLLATQLCLFNVINRLSLLLLIHIRAVPHIDRYIFTGKEVRADGDVQVLDVGHFFNSDQLFISVLRVHGDVVCVGDLLPNVNRSV